ncbi:NAD(P)/FAD-dependent oxidoreductase [Rhodovarius crocodyli]|uniref:NAD(P)/FAD-dependent oxidoreductase n=1 Tax=Rhodovarius crocodyli TaxID=1979269 RepID=A0A437MNR0_9PROT|nr:FAD-dependent oxidoreductase [Rhodovarius crocodyli]RVT99250.1 NAD(P)/FAD-dependent oxidoreductase [Rhodovarius crocodyli]
MRIVVIGAGPAGTRAAVLAAERVPGASVTLLGAEPALPYDRVALSRLLAGEVETADLITHSLQALTARGIAFRPGTRVVSIDRAARLLRTARGEVIVYDRLILALGSSAVRLPVPGGNLPGVVCFRDMADVRQMMQAAREFGRAVVIGGGLLGLEAAAGLAHRGMRVTVVHGTAWPMNRQIDAFAGGLLGGRMERRGIRFVMPAATMAIEGTERATGVRLADGRVLPAELVVMAVGIRPNTALAADCGLDVGQGIRTDAALRSSDPAIQAIGECAEVEGVCVGLVAPALEQAEAAIHALAGDLARWAPRPDSAALKISGTAVWSAGEIDAADTETLTLLDEQEDCYRRLSLRDGRLVGAVLYGDTADAGFYMDLIKRRADVGAQRQLLAFGQAYLKDAA